MDRRRFLVATGVLGTTNLAGCAGLGGDSVATPTAGAPGGEATVEMVGGGGNYFDPIGLYLKPGDTVSFVMKSGNHSATAYHESNSLAETTRIPDGAESFDSGVITERGKTFEHTFETKGTYDYYCTPHKPMGMVGRIVVGESGGPAEKGKIPDGRVPSSDDILKRESVSYDDFSG